MTKSFLAHFFGLLILVAAAVSQQPPPKVKAGLIPRDFSLPLAMRSLFGNYNRATHSSISTVPSDADLDGSSFNPGDQLKVKAYLISAARDEGVQKVFLLTYAVPKDEEFSCHGCPPLVGLAVFSKVGGAWKPESFSRAVGSYGGFGEPAQAQLVSIGPDRTGVKLTPGFTNCGFTAEDLVILVPWRGRVTQALRADVFLDNGGACGPDGDGSPCYSYDTVLRFVPGANRDYYDVELVLSGTSLTDDKPPKLKTVSGVERLQFVNGKYVRLSRTGDTTGAEPDTPK